MMAGRARLDAMERTAHERHWIIPGGRRFGVAAEHPGKPLRQRHAGGACGGKVLPDRAPARADAHLLPARPRQPDEIGVNERRNVDARYGPEVMPQAEAR